MIVVIIWIVGTYLAIGIFSYIVMNFLCWVTSGEARVPGPWVNELKSCFWVVVMWPLLAFGFVLVAMIYFTFYSIINKLSRSGRGNDRPGVQQK